MAAPPHSDSEFLNRRLSLIAQATGTPIGAQSPEELAERVVELLCEGFETDAAVARWLDDNKLHLLASRGIPGPKLQQSMPANIGLASEMFTTGQGILMHDVALHPLTREAYERMPEAFRFRSFCGVPLIVGQRAVGVLGLYDITHTHAYAPRDLEHLQVVGNFVAAAIDNTRLYKEIQSANRLLEARAERTTEELRESEARFRLLAEHAIDIISQHTTDGRFTYISPAVKTVLGWEPEEIVGRLPREFVHPDDRDSVISARPELLASEGRPVTRVYRFRTKAGDYRWVESGSRRPPEAAAGSTAHLVVVTRDVTRRRAAEQRLRLVQAAIAEVREAVVITDADLDAPGPRIVYVNPAFCAMTGYGAEEIEGKSPRILQGEQTDRGILDRLRAAMEQGESFRAEAVNYRKEGIPYLVEWDIAPVRQPDGKVTHWVSVQRDITQQRHDEQIAQLHRDTLAHDARLATMGELASGLAHELNQPLTAIANYANGALNRMDRSGTVDPGETHSVLRRVSDQATRAGAIIRRLRTFVSRRSATATDASLNDIAHEVIAFNELDSRARAVRVETALAPDLPPCKVDRIQIQQVVLNLLRNAIDAVAELPASRRWVRLSTFRAEDGTAVEMRVQDPGPGLDDDQLGQLFDPFFTTKPEGMGLGLTISLSLVEAHGGLLWAQKNPDRGLTMCLRLPVHASDEPASQ